MQFYLLTVTALLDLGLGYIVPNKYSLQYSFPSEVKGKWVTCLAHRRRQLV